MIVLFVGGPAQGLFQNIPNKDEIRVATTSMLDKEKAAFYYVRDKERDPSLRVTKATAVFSGVRDSAVSLVDLILAEPNDDLRHLRE